MSQVTRKPLIDRPEHGVQRRMLPAWHGVASVLAGHVILAGVTGGQALAFVGVAQVVYVLPLLVTFYARFQDRIVRGILATAVITLLVNIVTGALLCGFSGF